MDRHLKRVVYEKTVFNISTQDNFLGLLLKVCFIELDNSAKLSDSTPSLIFGIGKCSQLLLHVHSGSYLNFADEFQDFGGQNMTKDAENSKSNHFDYQMDHFA